MSLGEILPDVQSLSRVEKLRLIQILAQELAGDEMHLIEEGKSYPIWSPTGAFDAAAALIETLEKEKGSM